MDISQDKLLQKFLKAKQRKQSTINLYTKELGYYATYLNKTPTTLPFLTPKIIIHSSKKKDVILIHSEIY